MKHGAYHTRALAASDPRYARVFDGMGYSTADMKADAPPADGMAALRAEYERVVGKRPFNGWDAETLKAKIAEASQG